MWLSLKQGRLQLNGDVPLVFRRARGYWIECVDGRIWLTVTGQPGDFLLGAGERLRIESNGLALVAGLPAGSLCLYREAAWPLRSARLLWRRLRGVRPVPESSPAAVRAPMTGA
jgi:hypothetical protein